MMIGETDLAKAYKRQLENSPYNFNKEKQWKPGDPRSDGQPNVRAPTVKEMLK